MADSIRDSLRKLRAEKPRASVRQSLAELRGETRPEQQMYFNLDDGIPSVGPGASAAAPQQPQDDLLTRLRRNIETAAQQGYLSLKDKGAALAEIAGGIATGDFRPALEAGERVLRGAAPIVSSLGRPDAGPAYIAGQIAQAGPISEIKARADARRTASGDTSFRQRADEAARLEAEARAYDPSLSGRLTRGVVREGIKLAPTLLAGAVSGGSVPAIAATTAASSFDEPESLVANTALSALPAPAVGKFVAPLLRRVRATRGAGRAAAEAVETIPSSSRAPARIGDEGLPALEADISALPSSPSARSQGASMRGPAAESANFSLAGDDLAAIGNAGAELVTKAERTPVLEVISAARKAGLLTSVKTHIRNVAGTGGFQLSEEVSRLPAAVVDALMSRVTKQRTLAGPSLDSMRRSFHEAATSGVEQAREIWRKGITQADVERLGLNQEINSGSKVLDKYINSVFRSLSMEDKVLHTYATRRALESRARALALTEARQGRLASGNVNKRTKEILDNPPEDLAAGAVADAEVAVFTNENLVSKFLAGGRKEIEKLPGGRVATFGVDMVLPFTKTPSNIIARMLDYAGFGAAKETTRAIARRIVGKSMTADQQRAFATQFGRASIGSGLMALGYIGYRDGWLTGFIEDDPGRRERDEVAGRTPGSIKIGNRWHQILGAAPLASLMVIGATLAREVDQEREGSGLLPTLETFGQAVGEQPLLIGSKQVAESLTQPGTVGERFIGGAVGSFVPTVVSDVAESFDPRQRETGGAGILGAAQKRIPGARNLLPEAVDVFGQPRQDYGALQGPFDPTRATSDSAANTPILRELVRLDLGLTGFRKDQGETTADYRRRVETFGQLYQNYGAQLLDSTLYRDATDGDRREVIKLLNSRSKHIINENQLNRAQLFLSASSLFSALRERRERQEKERRGKR